MHINLDAPVGSRVWTSEELTMKNALTEFIKQLESDMPRAELLARCRRALELLDAGPAKHETDSNDPAYFE